MTSHLLFKFHYHLYGKGKEGITIDVHKEVIRTHKAVWWGQTSGISQERAEILKTQLRENIPAYVFLYCINVPKKIHSDEILWYRARIKNVSLSIPENKKQIPDYYSENLNQLYILLDEIEEIPFLEGKTPKVPGQTPTRHVSFAGNPIPDNLISIKDGKKLCGSYKLESTIIESPTNSEHCSHSDNLAFKVIDLQSEIILLKDEITNLKTYQDYYNKILNTDYLFSSEKFFENWIQENMHRIFPELEIIDRQPSIAWPDGKFGRLDLLAYNKESRNVVIVEVKTRKRSKNSGYDQFLRYTSWAKRNMNKLKEKYPDYDIQIQNVPLFILISDFVDDEMKAICKDHGIPLIRIFGGLGIEKY